MNSSKRVHVYTVHTFIMQRLVSATVGCEWKYQTLQRYFLSTYPIAESHRDDRIREKRKSMFFDNLFIPT